MNKKNIKTTKSKVISISNIENKVDTILKNNKQKLVKLDKNKINIEKFSLKNKEKNTIFYLRKKSKTKPDDSTDIKSQENKSDYDKSLSESKKPKKQYFFETGENSKKEKDNESNKESFFKAHSEQYTLRDLIDSKDFDMVVSDINRLIDKETKLDIGEEKERIFKKEIKTEPKKRPFIIENEKSNDVEVIDRNLQKNNLPKFKKTSKEDNFQSNITPFTSIGINKEKDEKFDRIDKREKRKVFSTNGLNQKAETNKSKDDDYWEKDLKEDLEKDVIKDNSANIDVGGEVDDRVSDDFEVVDEVKDSDDVSKVEDVGRKVKSNERKELKARKKELRAKEKELRTKEKKTKKIKKKELKAQRKELKARKKKLRVKKQKSLDNGFKTEAKGKISDDVVKDDVIDSDIVETGKIKDVGVAKVEDVNVSKAQEVDIHINQKELTLKEKNLRFLKNKYGSKFDFTAVKDDFVTVEDVKSSEKDEARVSNDVVKDDIADREVVEIKDVDIGGEVDNRVSDGFEVVDEIKDSDDVSKVEDVGRKVKSNERKELKARKRELRAKEKELKLKERKIKKTKEKERRLKEKKASKAKEKELKVQKKKPKFIKKEIKPDIIDSSVRKKDGESEVDYTVEDVLGIDKKKIKSEETKLEPQKEELKVQEKDLIPKQKKVKSEKVSLKGKGFFNFIKKLLKPKDKGITVIFGDVKVVDETKDVGVESKLERIDKKEFKARKKELRVQEKELKAKERKDLRVKGKDVVGVSRKGLFFKRAKSGVVGSDLDGEGLEGDVSGVSGDVVVVDEVEDVGVVSEVRPKGKGLRFGKKVDGVVGVDKKVSKARKKELRVQEKELKAKERKDLRVKGKDVVGVSRKGLFFKRAKSGVVGSDLDGEGLEGDVSGVSGDVVVVDEVEDVGVVSEVRPKGKGLRFGKKVDGVVGVDKKVSKARKKELRVQEKELKAKERKDLRVKGKDVVGVSRKGLFFKRTKSGVVGFDVDKKVIENTSITPMFRIDNIALNEYVNKDEAKLLDDKIKIFSEKGKTKDEDKQAASKAIELAKDHIKDKKMKVPKDLKVDKEIEKTEAEEPVIPSLQKNKNIDQEHVFFDEEEISSKGWSPRLSKPEKDGGMQQSLQQEIAPGSLQDVGYLELPRDMLNTDSVKPSDLGFSVNQWEELDFYSLNEPFAYVEILREKETLDKCYFLVEIALTKEEEKTLTFIKETISNLSFNTDEMEEKGFEKYLYERLELIIQEYNLQISEESRKKIFYYIGKSSLGLGKIDPLMKDPNIEDISCDGANVPIFLYHRKYGSLKSNVHFSDEDELSSFVHRLAQKSGKHISIAEPMLDATMPDGSRIQMTLSDEITAKGSTFTIRKFRDDPFSPPDIVEFNTMSSEMVAYMWLAIENGVNTLFAGGTASGKTTALNAVSLFIPRESKIVSIEETREINLPHPNWIPGVSRSGFGEVVAGKVIGEIDLYDLMKAALRQRPEYILVGEIRGREAYVLFQAMATGHATYSTVHADSAQSLIHRLEGKPINIPRVMLQSLDIVCLHVITRVKNMRARRCKQIIEIIDIDPTTKEILTNEVFRWDPVEDRFIYSGKSYVLERVRGEKDLTREEMTQEINKRRKIIEWMNKNNVREFRGVAKIVSQYSENPDDVMKKIEKDAKK